MERRVENARSWFRHIHALMEQVIGEFIGEIEERNKLCSITLIGHVIFLEHDAKSRSTLFQSLIMSDDSEDDSFSGIDIRFDERTREWTRRVRTDEGFIPDMLVEMAKTLDMDMRNEEVITEEAAIGNIKLLLSMYREKCGL